ncbi:unnamed protein product [Scomber scombrus]|uniref:Unnamed protein product n=1 Tax=Scomber scombrus TaxID=13677 RepID=A0AAV1N6Y7_SCOSC
MFWVFYDIRVAVEDISIPGGLVRQQQQQQHRFQGSALQIRAHRRAALSMNERGAAVRLRHPLTHRERGRKKEREREKETQIKLTLLTFVQKRRGLYPTNINACEFLSVKERDTQEYEVMESRKKNITVKAECSISHILELCLWGRHQKLFSDFKSCLTLSDLTVLFFLYVTIQIAQKPPLLLRHPALIPDEVRSSDGDFPSGEMEMP